MNSPRRGEIWSVEFDPTVGAEQRKRRPAVVVGLDSMGRLPLRIVVPITSWRRAHAAHAWLVRIEATDSTGLDHDSLADAFQVKSLSIQRFNRRLGRLTDREMRSIAAAIALCVGAPAA